MDSSKCNQMEEAKFKRFLLVKKVDASRR